MVNGAIQWTVMLLMVQNEVQAAATIWDKVYASVSKHAIN
jgi:hypothetical protein